MLLTASGRALISDVDACMTCLRVTVKDAEKLEPKSNGKPKALWACYRKGQGVQVTMDQKADVLKSDIHPWLGFWWRILKLFPAKSKNQRQWSCLQRCNRRSRTVADGQVIANWWCWRSSILTKDDGDGFAVEPEMVRFTQPVSGTG